jgi:hypothetical protein
MIKTLKERRVHPRLAHKLPLNLAVNGYDFSTVSRNISSVGAYCHLDKYMPPFTKISVKLSLPNKDEAGKNTIVECKGVVVRTEDEADGGLTWPSSLIRCVVTSVKKSPSTSASSCLKFR